MFNGRDAYEEWRRSMLDQGIGTDPWDSLEAEDQNAWQAVADMFNKGEIL